MSKKIYNFWLVFAIAISLSWTASAQTLVLDISGTPSIWTDSVTGNPSNCLGGGFWNDTYGNTTGFQIGSFKFTHNSGFDIYSYWGGFTTGANGDSRCYNSNCPGQVCGGSGSEGWIHNQWGVMAGGGLSSTIPITATKGVPYLISYWDYFSETGSTGSLKIELNGDSLFNLSEMYICNHPWPYYGNIYGDGFARPLNQPGDYFRLYIHGIPNSGSELIDSITLEHYDVNVPNYISQSPNWQKKSFNSRLWSSLKGVYFTMKSTDELVIGNTNYGPNTAVYFCLDKVKVIKTGFVASSSALQKVKSVAEKKSVQIIDFFPIVSYSGGEVILLNENNEEVLHTNVKAGDKINLSDLPNGNYRLKHGSKIIPISKIDKGGK
ncbi:MAG: DUF4465 domain-containing protein [Bacteroidales bacterium]|nr:DUF4465 domain-containing protein [Bacteroidales bacterium]